MRILWNLVLLMMLPFVMWLVGTIEKYPELAVPLFFIWMAVVAPALVIPDWHWHWKKLEKWRKTALKRDDGKLLEEIDEEMEMLKEWHMPATVGAVKSLLGKYGDKRVLSIWDIDKRMRD